MLGNSHDIFSLGLLAHICGGKHLHFRSREEWLTDWSPLSRDILYPLLSQPSCTFMEDNIYGSILGKWMNWKKALLAVEVSFISRLKIHSNCQYDYVVTMKTFWLCSLRYNEIGRLKWCLYSLIGNVYNSYFFFISLF